MTDPIKPPPTSAFERYMTDKLHPSHKTRGSDASSFDEICTVCGATDVTNGGWGALALPCPMTDTPTPDTPAVPEPVAYKFTDAFGRDSCSIFRPSFASRAEPLFSEAQMRAALDSAERAEKERELTRSQLRMVIGSQSQWKNRATTAEAALSAAEGVEVGPAVKLEDVQRGYDAWAAKPHNAKWVRRIDGTPIPNDLVICIFSALQEGA